MRHVSRPRAALLLTSLALGLDASPAAALAPQWSVGVLTGAVLPDAALERQQFETSPQPGIGARVRAGLAAADVGLRVWSSDNTQTLGLAGVEDPRMRAMSWDVTGRVRVARVLGQSLHLTASAGRLGLSFEPDALAIPTGGGAPVTVTLAPVHEWVTGAGLAVERSLGRQWAVDLEVEHRWYGLDTATQAGGSQVDSRERFGEWDVRVGWNWLHGR